MIQLLYDNEMRIHVIEILQEINSPKRIDNLECLKLIADILRFVLTLFVHEQEADPKLLACILDCSQNLFYQNKKRKQNISYYLVDHGIWTDTGAWRHCIEQTLKAKIAE